MACRNRRKIPSQKFRLTGNITNAAISQYVRDIASQFSTFVKADGSKLIFRLIQWPDHAIDHFGSISQTKADSELVSDPVCPALHKRQSQR
jgi:hypothetical protein